MLAATRPRRVAAPAAGHLSTHLGVPPGSLIETISHYTPRGLLHPLLSQVGESASVLVEVDVDLEVDLGVVNVALE